MADLREGLGGACPPLFWVKMNKSEKEESLTAVESKQNKIHPPPAPSLPTSPIFHPRSPSLCDLSNSLSYYSDYTG